MREIKFRTLVNGEWFYFDLTQNPKYWAHKLEGGIIDQYTGLKDKNGKGCYEVYECDIITVEGKIRGNIYENEPRKTDIVIPPIGTKAWNTTYKKTLERGFDYAE